MAGCEPAAGQPNTGPTVTEVMAAWAGNARPGHCRTQLERARETRIAERLRATAGPEELEAVPSLATRKKIYAGSSPRRDG